MLVVTVFDTCLNSENDTALQCTVSPSARNLEAKYSAHMKDQFKGYKHEYGVFFFEIC